MLGPIKQREGTYQVEYQKKLSIRFALSESDNLKLIRLRTYRTLNVRTYSPEEFICLNGFRLCAK